MTTFCSEQWAGLKMYIPASNPQYPYYYGLLLTSMTKSKVVLLANISVFNGTTACDISQTGYGVVLLQ